MFTRLLSIWVTGALLLPLSCGLSSEDEDDYGTPTPSYDYDYENSTLDYYTYNPNNSVINYEMYEILKDSESPRNKVTTRGNKPDLIFTGLLVILVCRQT